MYRDIKAASSTINIFCLLHNREQQKFAVQPVHVWEIGWVLSFHKWMDSASWWYSRDENHYITEWDHAGERKGSVSSASLSDIGVRIDSRESWKGTCQHAHCPVWSWRTHCVRAVCGAVFRGGNSTWVLLSHERVSEQIGKCTHYDLFSNQVAGGWLCLQS